MAKDGKRAAGVRAMGAQAPQPASSANMIRIVVLAALLTLGVYTAFNMRRVLMTRVEPQAAATLSARAQALSAGVDAKLAAQRHDPQQIAELNALLEEGMRLANNPGNMETLAQLNRRFHDSLGYIAANSVLQEVMHILRDRTAVLFAPFLASRTQQNWEEHAAILRAVIKGDAELASLLAARHVYNAAQMEP